jgi:hypothetical protein
MIEDQDESIRLEPQAIDASDSFRAWDADHFAILSSFLPRLESTE